jgi:hypothetical protein
MLLPFLSVAGIPAGRVAAPIHDTASMIGVALEVLFVVLLADLAIFYVWSVRRLIFEKPTFRPTWSYVDLWWVLQLIFAAIVLVMTPIILFAPASFGAEQLTGDLAVILPVTLLQNAIFWGVPSAVIAFKYRLPLREIGLTALPCRRDVVRGIGLGLLAVPVSALAEAALNGAVKPFSHLPFFAWGERVDANLPISTLIASVVHHGWWAVVLALIVVGPATGLGEEMLFRGFLFNLLKRRIGVWPGIVLSGLVFALVHGYFIGAVPVFLLGMALAYTYQRTGSLWTSILFHATNNGIAVLLACFFPSMAH